MRIQPKFKTEQMKTTIQGIKFKIRVSFFGKRASTNQFTIVVYRFFSADTRQI